MPTIITLRSACACKVEHCLHLLAQKALEIQGPLRPHVDHLTVLRMTRDMEHSGVEPSDLTRSWGIYSRPPSPGDPYGERVLGASIFGPLECDGSGRCPDGIELHLTVRHLFPLLEDEVLYHVYTCFGMHELAEAQIPLEQRQMAVVRRRANVQAKTEAESAQPRLQHAPGAPVLDTNEWLFEKMKMLAKPSDNSQFYAEYVERYTAETGAPPENPERCFRDAAQRALRRIQHQHRAHEVRQPA